MEQAIPSSQSPCKRRDKNTENFSFISHVGLLTCLPLKNTRDMGWSANCFNVSRMI